MEGAKEIFPGGAGGAIRAKTYGKSKNLLFRFFFYFAYTKSENCLGAFNEILGYFLYFLYSLFIHFSKDHDDNERYRQGRN